jgi:hypothetical protein
MPGLPTAALPQRRPVDFFLPAGFFRFSVSTASRSSCAAFLPSSFS